MARKHQKNPKIPEDAKWDWKKPRENYVAWGWRKQPFEPPFYAQKLRMYWVGEQVPIIGLKVIDSGQQSVLEVIPCPVHRKIKALVVNLCYARHSGSNHEQT